MRNKILVYIVWVFVLALGVQSCNNDPMPDAPKEQRPISFDNIATRATLTDLQANGFGVWAIVNNDLVEDLVLMNNQYVEHDETLGWVYDPVQYWIDKTKFTFLATYPYDESRTYFSYNTENKAVELKVSETPSEIDFLVATNETNTSVEGYSETVDLQFEHVLTSVGLNIWRDGGKHQNDDMRIKRVTLSNIGKAGTYTSTTNTWTTTDEKMTMEYEKNGEFSESDNIGAFVNGAGTGGEPSKPFGELMLLPQDIGGLNSVVALNIEYELKRQGATDWETATLEAELPSITWRAGQQYTYNVVLSQVKYITVYYIQTTVDPWGTPQVGGTVIIK